MTSESTAVWVEALPGERSNANADAISQAGVGAALRAWRLQRRLSQWDLALEAGISARHLSFIETGRSLPGVAVLLGLGRVLEAPLRERNRWLLMAGYAPRFPQQAMDSVAMGPALAALERLLKAHDPYPGLVLDAHWNVVRTNVAGQSLAQLVPLHLRQPHFNAFRAGLHPEGLARLTLNFVEWCGYLVDTLQRARARSHDAQLAAIEREVLGYANVQAALAQRDPTLPRNPPLLLPCELQLPVGAVSLFTTLTTFGTPRDVLLDELCVELFYPANDASEQVLRRLSSSRL